MADRCRLEVAYTQKVLEDISSTTKAQDAAVAAAERAISPPTATGVTTADLQAAANGNAKALARLRAVPPTPGGDRASIADAVSAIDAASAARAAQKPPRSGRAGTPFGQIDELGRWIVFAWPGSDTSIPEEMKCESAAPELANHQRLVPASDSKWPLDAAEPPFVEHATTSRALALNLAAVDLASARAHLAIASPEESRAAKALVTDKTAVLEAVASDAHIRPPSTSVFDLLSTGFGRVVADVTGSRGADVPVKLTTFGFVVLASLILLLLRWFADPHGPSEPGTGRGRCSGGDDRHTPHVPCSQPPRARDGARFGVGAAGDRSPRCRGARGGQDSRRRYRRSSRYSVRHPDTR